MGTELRADHLWIEVKHRCALPARYTWEIYCHYNPLPLKESAVRFRSWEEASKAGKEALRGFLLRQAAVQLECRPPCVIRVGLVATAEAGHTLRNVIEATRSSPSFQQESDFAVPTKGSTSPPLP